MDDRDVPESSTATKPKRPLFKKRKVKSASKSIPAAPASVGQGDGLSTVTNPDEEEDDGLDLFKRSKDFFPVFVKDQDEELAAERQTSESSDHKRRKISLSADCASPKSDLYDVSENEKERIRMRRDERPLTPPPTKDKSLINSAGLRSGQRNLGKGKASASPASVATPSKRAPAKAAASSSIVISDSDDDYIPKATASRRLPAETKNLVASPTRNKQQANNITPIEIDDDLEEVAPATDGPEEEGGEFAHFVVAARERLEKQKAERAAAAESKRGGKPVEERTIQVFVTSRLPPPTMQPVVFKTVMRKPIQVLRDTAVAFSASKGRPLTHEEENGAFLVWKDRRLYGSSTLMSLGIVPDANGDFSRTGSGNMNDGVTVDGQLHFELFTEEIYSEWMQQLERQRQRDLYQTMSDGEGDDGQKQAAVGQDSQGQEGKNSDKIRIFLKAKNVDQVKVSARANTEISELVAAFRNVRKVPPDSEVVIMFDGDKLAESDTVGDAGIEDRDVVDVLIR